MKGFKKTTELVPGDEVSSPQGNYVVIKEIIIGTHVSSVSFEYSSRSGHYGEPGRTIEVVNDYQWMLLKAATTTIKPTTPKAAAPSPHLQAEAESLSSPLLNHILLHGPAILAKRQQRTIDLERAYDTQKGRHL